MWMLQSDRGFALRPIIWLLRREATSSLSFARSRGTYKQSLRAALRVLEEKGERNNLSEDDICSTAGGKLAERILGNAAIATCFTRHSCLTFLCASET